MNNIALNKPATASNTVAPFEPAKAVDGITNDPKNRWNGCAPLPSGAAWLAVDLQNTFWVNQWFLSFMNSVGWGTGYAMTDFKLQGSLDNATWFDMDSVVGNTTNGINRICAPRMVKYVRVYITKGLGINNLFSSIVDFQAIEPANAPFLSALVSNAGAFTPAFSSRSFTYSINVASTVGTITFTPTALQSNMVIKVNNTVVASGQASQPITLNPGSNTVTIDVTSSDNAMKTTYTVTVVKAGAASYLSNLIVKNNHSAVVPLTPAFAEQTLSYTAAITSAVATVTVQPTAVSGTAVLKVNNVVVTSGQFSAPITMNTGINTITIIVDSVTTYTVTLTKS